MKKEKIPKDLGLKIGTKENVMWTRVAQESRILIEQSETNLVIQKEVLKLAESKIVEEEKKIPSMVR